MTCFFFGFLVLLGGAVDWSLIVQEVEQTPATPDWQRYFPQLPALSRRLRLASPCCGVHGSMAAMQSMGVAADSVNTYDLDERYEAGMCQDWEPEF